MSGVETSHKSESLKVITIVGLGEPFSSKMGLKSVHRAIQLEFNSINSVITNNWSASGA